MTALSYEVRNGRALIEAVSILAFMALMGLCASLPQPQHDPVSPDFRIAEAGR